MYWNKVLYMIKKDISILGGQVKCSIKNHQEISRYKNAVVFCVDDGYLSYALAW